MYTCHEEWDGYAYSVDMGVLCSDNNIPMQNIVVVVCVKVCNSDRAPRHEESAMYIDKI